MTNNPVRYFDSSPEVIRLAVMMYIRYPLSWRQVEDILFERGIDISHETVRFWWNRVGPMFAGEIRRRRVDGRHWSNGHWPLAEVCVPASPARDILYGELSTTQGRCLRVLSRNGGIAGRH